LEKPTSVVDVQVLLGPDISKLCTFGELGDLVIVRFKRRVGPETFAKTLGRIRQMGGRYGFKQFEIPLEKIEKPEK